MFAGVIGTIAGCCYLIASLVIISAFVKLAQEVNPNVKTGVFCFAGVFTTPITIGLYVMAMQRK